MSTLQNIRYKNDESKNFDANWSKLNSVIHWTVNLRVVYTTNATNADSLHKQNVLSETILIAQIIVAYRHFYGSVFDTLVTQSTYTRITHSVRSHDVILRFIDFAFHSGFDSLHSMQSYLKSTTWLAIIIVNIFVWRYLNPVHHGWIKSTLQLNLRSLWSKTNTLPDNNSRTSYLYQ